MRTRIVNSPPLCSNRTASLVLGNVHGCRARECTCQNFYLSSHLAVREKHGMEVRTMAGPPRLSCRRRGVSGKKISRQRFRIIAADSSERGADTGFPWHACQKVLGFLSRILPSAGLVNGS
ncbi:hypothetical protein X777_10620 [Ooceraea biroi]|uniref:Uncharacterized protein n=1 Tax=Ooceraea biroi TaxID=2015173 RepID=A0A026W2X5_OOCBI|nr:hypothetical protein X777_10620 [Ooceraea biroi]